MILNWNNFKLAFCSILNGKDKIVFQLKLSSKFKSLPHFGKDICGILVSTKHLQVHLHLFLFLRMYQIASGCTGVAVIPKVSRKLKLLIYCLTLLINTQSWRKPCKIVHKQG